MNKALVNIHQFKHYAAYLLENHLESLVEVDLIRSFEVDLPLLKFFTGLTQEQMYEMGKKSISDYLTTIVEDKALEAVEQSMVNWKEDKLPGIPRDKLAASDIALIYNVRKHSLLSFLTKYTSNPEEIVAIIKEIEDYYSYQESLAIETFAQINREEITKRETRLLEAQNLAHLGCWDFDVDNNAVVWSDGLYAIYGLDSEQPITAAKVAEHVFKEDVPALMEKVRHIYEHGGTFTHEYRIKNTKGEVRVLADKGYIELSPDGRRLIKGISQDVTEQYKTDEALQRRELLLQEAQAIAHLGSWEWDTVLNKVTWSDEMYRLFGYEPGAVQLDYDQYFAHVHPDDREITQFYINNCFTLQIPYTFEHRIIRKDGSIKWLLSKGQVTQTNGSQVVKLAGIAMDITDQKEASLLLIESEERFRLLAENSSDVISTHAPDALYKYVSPSCKVTYGFAPEEMVGTSPYTYIHPDDVAAVKKEHDKILTHAEAVTFECRYKKRDGTYLWMETVAKGVLDPHTKEIIELRAASRNITARKHAEDLVKKNEALLLETQELASVGSYEWDIKTDLSIVTPEVIRIFGNDPNEPASFRQFGNVIHPEDSPKVEEALKNAFKTGETYLCEYRIFRANDRELRHIWSKGKVSFDEHGDPAKLVGTVMDITERKIAEEKLQQKTEALIASNNELEAFCYTISHDLRAPLRAIDGFGTILSSQYDSKLDQEAKRLLEIMRSRAKHMGVLIDALLEFSRLGRKQILKYPLNMTSMVKRVVEQCKEQNPEHPTVFEVNELVNANGDRDLLHLVWHNLISNAIKFSSKTLLPSIEIGSKREDGKVVYFVKDNGAGFNMEYSDKLFGVFQRLHTDDEFPGTGVGLATVQRIVNRHGGQVWAESELGKGASFYFSLPYIL